MTESSSPKLVDLTWLARIAFAMQDRPTSTWLPPGQRLVGRRFNDSVQPEWMDDDEWQLRDEYPERAELPARQTRLKRLLCEGASLSPPIEVRRGEP